jgi:rhodanese-related sulfurtransferase
MQHAIRLTDQYIIINTMSVAEQDYLIKNTISYQMEENIINDLLNKYDMKTRKFVVYGKNANDESAEKKYKQLVSLGFADVYIYLGGMFEWVILQDIYGTDEFPTTRKVLDILKFKPAKMLGQMYY